MIGEIHIVTDKLVIIQKYPPVDKIMIREAEEKINQNIPGIYQQFLQLMNGVCMNSCILYSTDEIVEMYICNEFAIYAPQYISIGNDNGDRELVIRGEQTASTCGFLDAGAIGSAEPNKWFDFKTWVENGCPMDVLD